MSTIAELVEEAFLAGYRHGVEQFATWRSGEQLVGARLLPMRDVMRTAKEDCTDAYRSFLERRKRLHDKIDARGLKLADMP